MRVLGINFGVLSLDWGFGNEFWHFCRFVSLNCI